MKLGLTITSVCLQSTLYQFCPGRLSTTAALISMFPRDSKFIKLSQEVK